MAVKIRLRRVGAKKQPSYRVVVADGRSPRDGRFIEIIGHYNPRTKPTTIVIDADKARKWIGQGARPTESVASLLYRAGIVDMRSPRFKTAAPAPVTDAPAEADEQPADVEKPTKPRATRSHAKASADGGTATPAKATRAKKATPETAGDAISEPPVAAAELADAQSTTDEATPTETDQPEAEMTDESPES